MPNKLSTTSLSNFSESELETVKRLIRPQGIHPNPDFESEQFLGFLEQLNASYGELRPTGSAEAPSLRSIRKVPKPEVTRTRRLLKTA